MSDENVNLENVVTGPYEFKLKDGTQILMDDWSLGAELWAKRKYGKVDVFFSHLFGDTEENPLPDIETMLETMFYLSKPEYKTIILKDKGEHESDIECLARKLNAKLLKGAATSLMRAIMDAAPLEDVKKNMEMMNKRKSKRKSTKA